jgi:hypothetical protein
MRDDDGVDYLFRNAPAAIYIATANTWDAGMAAQNLEYAAVAQGMGVLYDGFLARFASRSPEALSLLQLDGVDAKPIAACMLAGYPAARYYRTAPKRQVDAVVMSKRIANMKRNVTVEIVKREDEDNISRLSPAQNMCHAWEISLLAYKLAGNQEPGKRMDRTAVQIVKRKQGEVPEWS